MGHRWVIDEPKIPFDLPVIYEDDRIIVVDKPHFLPTTPRGMWYRSSALMRLRERYNDDAIVPAHRLDRMTAGIVVFVREPSVRGAYQMLFQRRQVTKTYECLAPLQPPQRPATGTVRRDNPLQPFPLERRSRIVKYRSILQAREEIGIPNAVTRIERTGVVDTAHGRLASYTLHPRTGKTHQLRVHMLSLGLPIWGDDLYPTIRDVDYTDFSCPLELVARSLTFTDPITGEDRRFVSRVPLGIPLQ